MKEIREQISQWLEALGPVGPWLSAAVILVVGWLGCLLVRAIVVRVLHKSKLDERLAKSLGLENVHTESAVGKFVFYLLILFVFVIALDAAKLSAQAIEPLRELVDKFFAFLPNLVGAGLLTFVAFALAGIVRKMLDAVLMASRIDARLGLGTERPVSAAIVAVAYFLVVLLILPGILSVLGIESVSTALAPIIGGIIGYIPKAIGGGLILAVGIFLATIVRKTVYSVLKASGFDVIPQRLGHNGSVTFLGTSLSHVVSILAMITVIIFVAAQAIEVMSLNMLSGLAGVMVRVWGGVILFLAGLFVAGLARDAIARHTQRWAKFVYFTIAVFVGGMALQAAELTALSTQTMQVILYAAVGTLAVAFGIGGAVAIGGGAKPSVAKFLEKRTEEVEHRLTHTRETQPKVEA